MMVGRILIWLAACTGAAALCVFAANVWTLALFAAFVILPPLAAVGLLAAKNRVSAVMTAPETAGKGERTMLTLTVENTGLLPLAEMTAELTAENLLTGERETISVPISVSGRGTGRKTVAIDRKYAGLLRVTLHSLRMYELFRVFCVRKRCGITCEILTLPDTFEPRVILPELSGGNEDEELYAPDRPGWDGSEVFQVRDYRAGDSPRQIHWKLSAKLDRLIARDPSLPLNRSVLLFWERGSETETAAQADAMAEAVISVCRALLQQKILCRVVWNEAGSENCADFRLNEEEELYDMLPKLMQAGQAKDSGVERFLRLNNGKIRDYVVCVTACGSAAPGLLTEEDRLTVLLCGEGEAPGQVYRFSPENAAADLAELELTGRGEA